MNFNPPSEYIRLCYAINIHPLWMNNMVSTPKVHLIDNRRELLRNQYVRDGSLEVTPWLKIADPTPGRNTCTLPQNRYHVLASLFIVAMDRKKSPHLTHKLCIHPWEVMYYIVTQQKLCLNTCTWNQCIRLSEPPWLKDTVSTPGRCCRVFVTQQRLFLSPCM